MKGPRSTRPVSLLLLFPALLLAGACATNSTVQSGTDVEDDDQVAVGYGSQDESEVTGAVGSVSDEDIRGQEVTRLEDLINGRFAGVHVERTGAGLSVRIRGTSSFLGNGEPLFVVDGVPLAAPAGTALLAIDARNVKRIDILKDAGSTAIYGSRGANGVVLITTRRGE